MQIDGASGTAFGQADFIYTLNTYTQQHAVMEMVFDASKMGTIQSIQWSPGCGNDILLVEPTGGITTQGQVPEPASALVWCGLGLLVAGGIRRQRRAR